MNKDDDGDVAATGGIGNDHATLAGFEVGVMQEGCYQQNAMAECDTLDYDDNKQFYGGNVVVGEDEP